MTLSEAINAAKRDVLVDRVIRDERHPIDRDLAFRLVALRRWVMRVGAGGPLAQFHADLGGRPAGWMLTARGEQVAREEAERTV
ncbi:MAG TPA: hypothetical protein VK631_25130 [Solirubrobacteraceae bacterium]|nr:hypothetical protein [Solirubrobacteraceae bacterium]